MQLTSQITSYVSRRIRCAQSADDVLQEIAIAAWRGGVDAGRDAKLLMTIARRAVALHIRKAVRRESVARTWLSDVDAEQAVASASETVSHDAQAILDRVPSSAREDVERWMAGEQLDAASRQRVSRTLRALRAEFS